MFFIPEVVCECCLREFLFILSNGDFHRSMQRDNLRKRENDKTAAKAGISPSSFGFPSAHPFPTPSPLLPAFAFYYSAEVCGLKAWLMRYGLVIFYRFCDIKWLTNCVICGTIIKITPCL